ncbi:hypothetical protein [Nocardia sp. CA-135398]|uniref:hypothetical protein n=1 Tax=Nocardia sp. CA-135398 TaxID=3239977 RepID=UPI003D99DFFA
MTRLTEESDPAIKLSKAKGAERLRGDTRVADIYLSELFIATMHVIPAAATVGAEPGISDVLLPDNLVGSHYFG